jgi:hypothetical protein
MVNRDYIQELGLPAAQKKVSKPLAVVILVALAIGGWYVVTTIAAEQSAGHAPRAEAVPKR